MSGPEVDEAATRVAAGPRPPGWRANVALALGVTVTVAVVISANHGGRLEPDLLAYLWAVGLGAVMLVRRQYPVLVLTISVLGLFAYYAVGYPAVGVAVPVAAALYSAAEMGRLRAAVGAAGLVVLTSVGFRLAEGQSFAYVVGFELAGHVLLLAAATALGDAVRSRRQVADNARALLDAVAEQERSAAELAAAATRTRISRELHDAIGHSTSVITLHADVAREALPVNNTVAQDALRVITSTSQTMMTQLRETVRLLRSPGRTAHEVGRLEDIERIAAEMPMQVTASIELSRNLDEHLDRTAFRIVQESLTNVIRHSTATHVHVEILDRQETLHIAVMDNGRSGASGVSPGVGIAGMRERARELGGSLQAKSEPQGFVVRGRIPVEAPR